MRDTARIQSRRLASVESSSSRKPERVTRGVQQPAQ